MAQNNITTQPSSKWGSKSLKIILGIATILPILYSIINILIFFTLISIGLIDLFNFYYIVEINNLLIPLLVSLDALLNKLFYSTIILTFILSSTYLTIVFKNTRIYKKKKAWWAMVFSLGIIFAILAFPSTKYTNLFYLCVIPLLAMSIYWYRYIWKEPKQNQVPGKKNIKII